MNTKAFEKVTMRHVTEVRKHSAIALGVTATWGQKSPGSR